MDVHASAGGARDGQEDSPEPAAGPLVSATALGEIGSEMADPGAGAIDPETADAGVAGSSVVGAGVIGSGLASPETASSGEVAASVTVGAEVTDPGEASPVAVGAEAAVRRIVEAAAAVAEAPLAERVGELEAAQQALQQLLDSGRE